MTLDALATRRLREDFRDVLLDARIDKVLHPAENALALDVFGRRGRWQLVLSVSPQAPAAFLTRDRLGRQDERTSPFLLLARKYLRGGRIRAIDQIDFDRVLVFDVDQREDGEYLHSRLVVELTGRLANLVLTDDTGVVHDALRRVPGTINRVRTLMPKSRYAPPPVAKPAITALDAARLGGLARAVAGQVAWRVIVDTAAGVSPLLAREAVYRVGGDSTALVRDVSLVAALDEIRSLIAAVEARTEPVTGVWDGGRLIAFAPYRLSHLSGVREAEALSDLIATSYGQGAIPAGIESRRQRLLDRLDSLIGRQRRIADDLTAAIHRARDAERVRVEGELLLAYQQEVMPGRQTLQVGDVSITLDPAASAVDQAQERFRQYRKLRSMAEGLPERLATAQARLELLETLRVHAETATSADELQAVEAELESPGRDISRRPPASSRRPGKAGGKTARATKPSTAVGEREIDGWPVLYGRTATQNARVTFDLAAPEDLWLHARGVPGAHVVLRTGRRTPPDAIVARAAALAASLSGARQAAKVEVDVTEVRHVRKRPGAGPGMVTYRNERTITVEPSLSDEADWHES